MINISSVRLAVPKASAGDISRKGLVETILGSPKKLIYINAGAGYGKTTLLSQVANSIEDTVWVTLDGESDVFTFLNILSEAFRQTFPDYDFSVSEYLPFEKKSNFITILANAFINRVEKLAMGFMIIIEDLHTTEEEIKKLAACIMKYLPDNIRLCISSREAPWQELIPMQVKGGVLELTQKELAFTRDEVTQVLGFDDVSVYDITEGWPLAIRSYKVLLENGVSLADLPSRGNEALYSYLFFECLTRLSSEIKDFLKASACFEELDAKMLDFVLNKNNTRLILESLVARNIFIIKTDGGNYRYHTLFREYLLDCSEDSQVFWLQSRAAAYYFENKQYPTAAKYAIRLDNKELLEQIILINYKDHIKSGNFNELRGWFRALGDSADTVNYELLVAKGAFLSSIGNFTEAKTYLDIAIPLLKEHDQELYVVAMVHKARVLRNFISFEESNQVLDELIARLDNLASELAYTVVIEKVYNLCWNSQINDAYTLTHHMIEVCAQAGNIKVKAWFERYLSVIHFLAGRMKDAVYYYEKSLQLPENERQYLERHSIDIYTAKAYQMLGERDKAVLMISAELQKLRSTGRYEELWLGYLFAAEIHYQNTFIDRENGGSQTFEVTIKYFTLAKEYASLYRKTEFQMHWAKMQYHIYSLMFSGDPKDRFIDEIYANLDLVADYFKTIALARLFSYFGTVSDFPSAVKCAKLSIEIGEKANMMLIPTMAYGILARTAIAMKDHEQSVTLTRRFLQLCYENGIYEYFRMRKAYDAVLAFAFDNGVELDITKQMMEFAGYTPKKVYIQTLGGFSVFSYENRQEPLKMRSKKERELLAFLIDAGSEGVTKEQIYNAIWTDSKSGDIKKLIGVNLAHLKKDLESFGLKNPVINQKNYYRICRDEIVMDIDLFETSAAEFEHQNNSESAQNLLSLYKGEYLSDFEALWAISKRIRFHEIYAKALNKLCQAPLTQLTLPKLVSTSKL
jgi:tetratricopeptide (TPR) repeat protein